MLRRLELTSGLAVTVFGILGWCYALFSPAYRSVGMAISSDGKISAVSGTTSLAQKGLEPTAVAFFVVALMIVVSFAAAAYWHSQRRARAAHALLWVLASLLWIAVALGAASIGVVLLPAALLAAVTVVAGSVAQGSTGAAKQS